MGEARSLRLRITVAATVVVATALVLAAAGLVWTVRDSLIGRQRAAAAAEVDRVADQVSAGQSPTWVRRISEESLPLGVLVVVLDGNGDPVQTNLPPEQVSIRGLRIEDLPRPPPGGDAVMVRLEANTRSLAIASRTVDSPAGVRTVVAISPLAEVSRAVDSIVRALMVGTPLLVAFVAGVSWVVVGRALRPMEALRAEVEDITHSTLDRRLPEPGSGDEIDRLASTMNGMLDRLESAARREREFVADASHELRSPVAAIRTELEVALRDPEADWRAVGHDVLAEDERLERLVDDLLILARLSEATGPPPDAEVDLDDVVSVEAGRLRDVQVDLDVPAARVRGSAEQLGRAVRNLLENAARHARGQVTVELVVGEQTVTLAVEDDGAGIPEADRERVFERFTRLDGDRSRARGGVGLGLALARRIARHHGGALTVTGGRLGGARFVLTLPSP